MPSLPEAQRDSSRHQLPTCSCIIHTQVTREAYNTPGLSPFLRIKPTNMILPLLSEQ